MERAVRRRAGEAAWAAKVVAARWPAIRPDETVTANSRRAAASLHQRRSYRSARHSAKHEADRNGDQNSQQGPDPTFVSPDAK